MWKSFSMEPREVSHEDLMSSEGAAVKEVSSSYGEVVPAIRYQLAEQGNTQAQLEVARELLIQAKGEEEEEEVKQLEERAMYWLLRAAEQGDTEAVQTIKALSCEGRGLTDHNYVDVVNISTMPEDLIKAGYVGRKLFRSLSCGQEFVTSLQISRLVGGDQTLPGQPLSEAKHSQRSLVSACSQYMRGDLPQLAVSEDSSVVGLLTSRVLVMMISLTVYLYQLSSLQVSLWATLPAFTSLSTLTVLSVSTLQTNINQRKVRAWSSLVKLFSDKVDTEKKELKYLSRQNLTPFLVSFSLLSLTGVELHLRTGQPVVWSFCLMTFIGSLSSALSLPRVSKSFLIFLVISVVCWTSQLESVVQDLLPVDHQLERGQLAGVAGLLFLLQILLTRRVELVLLELQAFIWESVVLSVLTGRDCSATLIIQVVPLVLVLMVVRDVTSLRKTEWFVSGCCLLLLAWRQSDYSLAGLARPVSSLSWPQYRAACLARDLTLGERETCQHFTGLQVQWSGHLTRLQVRERTNTLETFVNMIPDPVREWSNVDCVLGDRSVERVVTSELTDLSRYGDCHSQASPPARLLCEARTEPGLGSRDQCHLDSFSSTTFHLTFSMAGSGSLFSGGEEVTVLTRDRAVLHLVLGQKIAVTGRLNTRDVTATVLDTLAGLSVLS